MKPFRTAFVRPDQFRFEADDPDPEKPYVVWAKGDEVRTWWHVRPGVQKPPSLARGIAAATDVSGGSAHTIPTLLLPGQIGGRSMASLTDLTRLPDEAVDDTPCFKLQGKFADQPTTLWLEKEWHRMDVRLQCPQGHRPRSRLQGGREVTVTASDDYVDGSDVAATEAGVVWEA